MQYFVLKFQNGEREVEKPCLLHKGQEKRLLGKRVTGFNQGGNTEGPISDYMVGSPLYFSSSHLSLMIVSAVFHGIFVSTAC